MTDIEATDRGIVVSKSLAWTMIAGLIGAGLWMGSNMAESRTLLSAIAADQVNARQERLGLESRLRTVEASRASDSAELTGLRRDLTDFRTELREVAQLLREARP